MEIEIYLMPRNKADLLQNPQYTDTTGMALAYAAKFKNKKKGVILTMVADNVSYQRVEHISEWNTLPDSTTTILNCNTTTLGTNYNYIRSS